MKYKLSKENKEGYLQLREDFNAEPYLRLVFDPIMFYCLVTHSFNYNIHINSRGQFSVPSGATRCYFNEKLKGKLEAFQWELKENKERIVLKTDSFDKIIDDAEGLIKKSVFYVCWTLGFNIAQRCRSEKQRYFANFANISCTHATCA